MKNSIKNLSICTLATLMAAPLMAMQEGEITIWINGDKSYDGLAQIGQQFEQDTGIKIIVQHPESLEAKFQQHAATGSGPDIIFWAHDRFGGYAEAGLLHEIKPSKQFKEKLVDFSWDAVTVNGKLVGYPLAIEAPSLIYNKDLLPTPPKTWEELVSIHNTMEKQGKKAIMWDIKNAYFTWPVISSGGAYAFEKIVGGCNAKSTGVNNEAGINGLQFLVNMVNQGVLNPNMDYAVSDAAFSKGEVAMTINGPWSWGNLDKLGINYGVAELPTLNGGKGNPFVGILSAGINSASPNTDLAVEFLENYVFQDDALKIMNDDKPLGAVTLKSFQKILEQDQRIKATMINAENGEIMPNIPQMTAYWFAEGAAIDNAMQGKQGVKEALDMAAKQITK
ncbi:maltose/maltodextrin ABC transporter substrate-binding protein MalE [Vibrio anguillarum]|uniref:maltose/maltodextrin ABC transporter substrate-binding protein MalE n=1 Tax=Vibrio anguillarum TaxID=55601 RepID=UPI00097E26F0|nr:maltose/maltodextrin ABC transporter substrate-binding protein MalE [Vibrio anguillarum]MBF4282670.1 maltose/maltodextrin ABC transporter substrate-binding protein MalE [Vibrio anguillarum]MBF4289562.1 maltose/maltodextrin ABC transporter substrate-binding protein MalE [Vibrio anguillarum]MBF4341796.1 maltose/maltodextrin ABC transporter substrate-binding protein MalE [Vibrio anguillarum]MBF4357729.1 maltose/maltodextrin ABC transporter substrate-binding protein MalE [Vibrio anguillarum]MBF